MERLTGLDDNVSDNEYLSNNDIEKIRGLQFENTESYFLSDREILSQIKDIKKNIQVLLTEISEIIRKLISQEDVQSMDVTDLFNKVKSSFVDLEFYQKAYEDVLKKDMLPELSSGQKIFMVFMMITRGSFTKIWEDRLRKGKGYNESLTKQITNLADEILSLKNEFGTLLKKYESVLNIDKLVDKKIKPKLDDIKKREERLESYLNFSEEEINKPLTGQELNAIKKYINSVRSSMNDHHGELYIKDLPIIKNDVSVNWALISRKTGINFDITVVYGDVNIIFERQAEAFLKTIEELVQNKEPKKE